MSNFGDHGMEGELRALADQYAAAMGQALTEVQAGFSGRPASEVREELTARLFAAGVPFDNAEVIDYAQQISDGRDVLGEQA